MSLLYKLGAMAVLALSIFLAGMGYQAHRASVAELKDELQASEDNREAERLAGKSMTRISDALTKDRLATAGRAAQLERRLRDIANSSPSPAPNCPSRNDDARPAAAAPPLSPASAALVRPEPRLPAPAPILPSLHTAAAAASSRRPACP